MQYREHIIYTGEKFYVPENIQRIDIDYPKSTHGWQVRYAGKTKFFSDHNSERIGAEQALQQAIVHLTKMIDKYRAPTSLRRQTSPRKKTDLPLGISGPLMRVNKGRNTVEYNYSISIPRFGLKPTTKRVYIGTDKTFSPAKCRAALKRAKEIRKEAEKAYILAATEARRADNELLLEMSHWTEADIASHQSH
ncbi:hypothetical protein [Agitococcus lubricus]|uniref:AP2 domain-containing protein n=1 Tax=Agitococcus lubricus TaxID=1077255 RepID=A0A2T5IY90_9GAMM|nr:hypothetical protein [Agitococcus lubricus]PTQ88917.1 hypothetical protein C8N29_11066 [Agitococcus lubricus]